MGQTSIALDCCHLALDISREVGNWNGAVSVLSNIGTIYHAMGQVKTAIDYYWQAMDIARETNERPSEGGNLCNLGLAYRALGQVAIAFNHFQLALTIAREIEDRGSEGNVLCNLGTIYSDLGQVATALDHYQQSFAIAHEIRDRSNEGNALGNLGKAQIEQKEVSLGIGNLKHAVMIACEIQSPRLIGHKASQLAEALLLMGDLTEARSTILQACEVDVPENNHGASALRGVIEARLGNRDAAQQAFTTAVSFANHILEQTPNYYDALYARGLARTGLALVAGVVLEPALEDYRAARAICDAAGVLRDARSLLEQLMKCPGGEVITTVLAVLS